jgi:hypothetical protein
MGRPRQAAAPPPLALVESISRRRRRRLRPRQCCHVRWGKSIAGCWPLPSMHHPVLLLLLLLLVVVVVVVVVVRGRGERLTVAAAPHWFQAPWRRGARVQQSYPAGS